MVHYIAFLNSSTCNMFLQPTTVTLSYRPRNLYPTTVLTIEGDLHILLLGANITPTVYIHFLYAIPLSLVYQSLCCVHEYTCTCTNLTTGISRLNEYFALETWEKIQLYNSQLQQKHLHIPCARGMNKPHLQKQERNSEYLMLQTPSTAQES